MKKYVILILIYTSIIFGQAKQNSVLQLDSVIISELNSTSIIPEIDIRYESMIMFTNIENNNITSIFPLNLEVNQEIKFLKYYKASLRFGIITGSTKFPDDFNLVFEVGLFFRASLLKSNIYGIIGVNMLTNNGNDFSHGTGPVIEHNGLTFYNAGLGYMVSEHWSFDVMYSIPNNKKFGHVYDYIENKSYDKFVNGIITIGYQYTFIL